MARHQLQRFASPSPSISLIIHMAGIASFASSFQFLMQWDTPLATSHGWYFQFLTIIGLAVSLAAFSLGAAADIFGSSTLFQIKNAVSVIATPLEVVISILYWSLHLVDPSLIVQPGFELSAWVDIGFHLAPALLLSLDLVLLSPPWTISAYGVMSLSTLFAFSYWYWVELCFNKNGWYGYFDAIPCNLVYCRFLT